MLKQRAVDSRESFHQYLGLLPNVGKGDRLVQSDAIGRALLGQHVELSPFFKNEWVGEMKPSLQNGAGRGQRAVRQQLDHCNPALLTAERKLLEKDVFASAMLDRKRVGEKTR